MKRKILIIAPSSIPTYGAEAIVNRKLLTALAKCDKFEIDLISQKVKYKHYPTEDSDFHINSTYVVENDFSITVRLIWEHILAFFIFGITYKGMHWAVKVLPIAEKLIKENNYDYILTKDAPSYVLGNYFKKKYGKKWVATWNDPYPGVKYPLPYGKGCKARGSIFDRMCVSVMKNADVHIFPSNRLRNYMLQYMPISIEKTIVIPHVILETNVINELDNSRLRIIHSGTLQRPRDPQTFLKAFAKFINTFPESKVEVDILGIMEKEDISLIEDLQLQNHVKFLPPVTYSESVKMLSYYHLALIIEADCEEGIFLPTKVTDFMQYRKPIFAVSPKVGVLKDLYNDKYVTYFADVTNVNEIYQTLINVYKDFTSCKISEVSKMADSVFSEETVVNQYYNL